MTGTDFGYATNIADELKELARPLEDAHPHPDNARKHRLEKIAQSLSKHGQRSPIIVQASTGNIVKGNGTWEAAKILGWHELAMVFQEMSDEEAFAYLLDDNRPSDLASYDRKKLHAGLKRMMDGPGLLDTLWEVEEFEDLDEEFRGIATLPPKSPDGTPEQAEGVEAGGTPASPVVPGEKMREVPIVLTAADHALFVERLRILKKAFHTSSTIDTIVEAVRRQATAEAEGATMTGASLDEGAKAVAVREWANEFIAVVLARWQGVDSIKVDEVVSALRANLPMQLERAPADSIAPVDGQVSMDEVLVTEPVVEVAAPETVTEVQVSHPDVTPVADQKPEGDDDFPF